MCVQHTGETIGIALAPLVANIFIVPMEITLMERLMRIGVC
jgi:hypothetical protein